MRPVRLVAVLAGAYLLLSAAELTRALLFERSSELNVGLYPPERVVLPEGERVFSWTRGDSGSVKRPLWGPVVRVPVYLAHPQPAADGTTLALLNEDDAVLDTRALTANGWHRLDYYLPPLLGADPWRDQPATMQIDDLGRLAGALGEAPFMRAQRTHQPSPDYLRVFTGWNPRPGPPAFWLTFAAGSTFVPSDYLDVADDRRLGVGIGHLLWMPELPPQGLGLFAWETHEDEPFRWAGARASMPVPPSPPNAGGLAFRMRPADPDATERPVRAELYWQERRIESIELSDAGWVDVTLELNRFPDTTVGGVLTIYASRTWNPARAGVAADDRDLGVAITEPAWY